MKINAKQYAIALYESIEENTVKNLDKISADFILTLDKNGHLNLFNKILQEYNNYYNNKKNITDALITTAHEPGKKVQDNIEKELKNFLGKNIFAKYFLNPDLIGGFTAKTNDYLIDSSLKTQLKNLKNL